MIPVSCWWLWVEWTVRSTGGLVQHQQYCRRCTVVVKRELSKKAKLLIYRLIFIRTITYGHELWVKTNSKIAGSSSRIEIPQEGGWVQPISGGISKYGHCSPHSSKGASWGGSGVWSGCRLVVCLRRSSGCVQLEGGLGVDPGLAWNPPGRPENDVGEKDVWVDLFSLLPGWRRKMDVGMDGCIYFSKSQGNNQNLHITVRIKDISLTNTHSGAGDGSWE